MKACLLVVLLVVLPFACMASSSCTQLFSALSINGVQYPVHATEGYPPPVVSGLLPLNLQFSSASEIVFSVNSVSVRYTIDNQPVGPVLTDNFAWSFDTSTIADGTHSLSVLYINEPASTPCNVFIGRQYTFVVSNSGRAISGAQTVPVVAPPSEFGPLVPQYADFIAYAGGASHSASHPYSYHSIPPAGGLTPTDLWSEPLLGPVSNVGEALPSFWKLGNGSVVEDPLFDALLGCDDLRKPNWGFDVLGPAREQRKADFDGLRGDVRISSYSKFTANLDGPGYYGISMDGRLFLLNMDGSVQTLAGWSGNRQDTPYHYLDDSMPLSQIQSAQVLTGVFDHQFYFPSDLAIDPNNHSHIFVADMNNHRIALVDLSVSPPVISTYAGVSGHRGYRNGSAATSLFNQPSSIAIAGDGTIYVADAENSVIRKIDQSRTVTTLVGVGPLYEPPNEVVAASPLTYAPTASVPFAASYINYPNTLRFDSKGNLVLAETVSQAIRYIDLNAQTVKTLAQFSNVGSSYGEEVWLDVDRKGNIGQQDDIIASMVTGKQNGLYRVPIVGTNAIPLPPITTHGTYPIYSGHTNQSAMPWTSGPWAVAIDDQEGRLIVSGVQSSGVASLRLVQSSDAPFQLNPIIYAAGRAIWIGGTVPNFPLGSRPSFASVHGFEGHSGLGTVLNCDDMITMSDGKLAAYLQSGAEGSVPRPELTGNDLRNVIYYIRRSATGGDSAVPGPDSLDKTLPVISGVIGSQQSASSMSVGWTSSKSSLGYVAWGTTSGSYFGWSPLEFGYQTNHSISAQNLPAGEQIFFVVYAKDQAGNQSRSPEQSIFLY